MLTSGSIKGGLQGTQATQAASQGAVVVASGAGGQQIVLPASALQGSQLNLKGLQAFHTLKVIPASQVTQQQRGLYTRSVIVNSKFSKKSSFVRYVLHYTFLTFILCQ